MVLLVSGAEGTQQGSGATPTQKRGIHCDFCSEPTAAFVYPTHDYVAAVKQGGVNGSLGAWAACLDCHRLIQQDDRVELAHRAAVRLARKQGVSYTEALSSVVGRHEEFFANRTGSPAPIGWAA